MPSSTASPRSLPPARPSFRDITPKAGERALLIGGTRKGKSTLEDFWLREWVQMYPKGEVLLIDSKPRFRAEETVWGLSAARHYDKQAPGPTIPGSCRLDLGNPAGSLRRAFNKDRRIAIAQSDREEDRPAMLEAAREMYENRADGKTPRLVVVDECHDFFNKTGWPLYSSDILLRVSRAGGERGLAEWIAAQRPRGIPVQFADFADKIGLFQLNNRADVKYLWDFGFPRLTAPDGRDITAPDTPHIFRLWDRSWATVLTSRVEVPPHYLAMLSAT